MDIYLIIYFSRFQRLKFQEIENYKITRFLQGSDDFLMEKLKSELKKSQAIKNSAAYRFAVD